MQGLVKGKTYKDARGRYLTNYEEGCLESYEKMSKSKGNGVIPSEMSSKFGVDALRCGLLFGAPPESDFNFDETILQTLKSYLDRV